MAHLWVRVHDETTGGGPAWAVVPLDRAAIGLTPEEPRRPPRLQAAGATAGDTDTGATAVRLEPTGSGGKTRWVAIAGPGSRFRINGLPAAGGFAVLDDRDEIRVGDADSVFFSTERPAEIAGWKAGETARYCPRCSLVLEDGQKIVRCPACDVAHHWNDDREQCCWRYSEGCATCGEPTALDRGFTFCPEDL